MTTPESRNDFRYIVLDALGILAQNLGPIAAQRLRAAGVWHYQANGRANAVRQLPQTRDASQVLAVMRAHWNEAFEPQFEYRESRRVRQLLAQVIDIRNTYEGHPAGDYRYADEALVDIRRLLEAFSAAEGARQVSALKQELARLMFGNAPPQPPPLYANPPVAIPPPAVAPAAIPNTKRPASPPAPTPASRLAGPWPPGQSVRRAIEQSLAVGQVLYTPSGRSYFSIIAINNQGVRVDKISSVCLRWPALEGIAPYLRGRGAVKIGAINAVTGAPGTLDGYLKYEVSKTMTASYVAPILVAAGVVEYVHTRAMGVRLLPPFTEENAT